MNTRLFLPALLAASLASAQPAAPDTARAKPDNPPAAADAKTEMQKWIEATDAQWQAAFKRDVTEVHEADLNKVKLQYLTSLEDGFKKASGTGDLEGAIALRDEQKRFGDTQVFPEQDADADAASVKQIRVAVRAQIARLEKDRATRAKALHAKYDQALAQVQTQLTQRQRLEDALLVKAKREEVAAAWLAGVPAPVAPAVVVESPKPPTPLPIKPSAPIKPPPVQKTAKTDEAALAAKLEALGCKLRFGDAGKRRGLFHVEIRDREWTKEEFAAICEQLGGIKELMIKKKFPRRMKQSSMRVRAAKWRFWTCSICPT